MSNGDSITISGLPLGTHYSVSESDSPDYLSSVIPENSQTGTITEEELNPQIHFLNTLINTSDGTLSISKQVDGLATSKEFTFTVRLTDENGKLLSGSWNYFGSRNGTLSNNGSIKLKHNELITIIGIPIGTHFTVMETETGGYTSSVMTDGEPNCNTGVISQARAGQIVEFVNTPLETPETGKLKISKTVAGAATTQEFTFTVDLRDADGQPLAGSWEYTGSKSGSLSSGGSVRLAHNESITIHGLPVGTRFMVSESNSAGYAATITTDGVTGVKAGTITASESGHQVQFVNAPPTPPTPPTYHPPHEDPVKPVNPSTPQPDPQPEPTPEPTPIPEPETPDEPLTELPDPNTPGSPERVTIIDENGVPRTYIKVWDDENEEWVYLPEDELPLAMMDGTPQTGDKARPMLWAGLVAASLVIGYLLLPRNRKKHRIRKRRRNRRS